MSSLIYDEWCREVSEAITQDALWKIKVYRLSLFLADASWNDIGMLSKTIGTQNLANQLYRAIGSIGANVAEGFSRFSPLERAKFYEYALGSARESRDWYFKVRHVIGKETVEQRYVVLTQIIRLLITMIPKQRNMTRESSISYGQSEEETM